MRRTVNEIYKKIQRKQPFLHC